MKKNTERNKKLTRYKVAGLPLIYDIIERMNLRQILHDVIGVHGNEAFPAVDTLILLIINLTLGKQPLYELEQWVQSLDSRCLGYKTLNKGTFNDDRFGRALDKLYKADRATLMTQLVVGGFNSQVHQMSRFHHAANLIN